MKKENSWFICAWCGIVVEPAQKTSRNHCPQCFLSLHVDLAEPGDRLSGCGGRMVPYEYLRANGELKIHFKCIMCKQTHRNKAAEDDQIGELDTRMLFRKEKYRHKMRGKRK